MRRQFIFILLCLFLSGCASDLSNLNYGQRSFKQGQYDKAFCLLLPLAQKGNPDAEYAVGYMYYYGKGVVEDPDQADYWMKQAACHGQPLAIQALQAIALVKQNCPDTPISPYPPYEG